MKIFPFLLFSHMYIVLFILKIKNLDFCKVNFVVYRILKRQNLTLY